MVKFDIITIFPDLFSGFLNESLLARAQAGKLIKLITHDLRRWTVDNHKTVDGRPYGGGVGMVLKVEPIFKAVKKLTTNNQQQATKRTRVILLSAKGKTFTQKDARRLSKYDQLIFICGRYEGVDERVAQYIADEEISIGNYVLFGGEVASMVVIEAVSRLIPGVVQKEESIINESFSDKEAMEKEHPQYTRPEIFVPTTNNQQPTTGNSRKKSSVASRKLKVAKAWKVPKVLLSGDHKKIAEWRKNN